MSQIGRYKTPDELRDEDKWFKFFTLPQLAAACGVLAADGGMVVLSARCKAAPAGACAAVLFTAAAALLIFVKMPKRRYLLGGGLPLYEIARRLVAKKAKSRRVIYVRAGLSPEGDEAGREARLG